MDDFRLTRHAQTSDKFEDRSDDCLLNRYEYTKMKDQVTGNEEKNFFLNYCNTFQNFLLFMCDSLYLVCINLPEIKIKGVQLSEPSLNHALIA